MCEFIDKLEAQGQLKLLAGLVKKGLLTIQQAAKEMGMSVAKFKALTKKLAPENSIMVNASTNWEMGKPYNF